MIFDRNMQVSTSQVVTASGLSTDVLDLKQDRDIGIGQPVFLIANVKAVSGTTPTIQVAIQTADNAAMTSPVTLVSSPSVAATANMLIVVPLPRTNLRYLAAYYTVGGTTPSITLDSYFSAEPPPGWQAYPGAIPG